MDKIQKNLNKQRKVVTKKTSTITKNVKGISAKTIRLVERYPLKSFFGLLMLLFVLIFIGSTLRKPEAPVQAEKQAKSVELFHIGAAPRVSVQGTVEKSGVITIGAQMPGIVRAINVTEGNWTKQGQVLVSMASNYFGGNSASIQRQLAKKQHQQVVETFDLQKEIIAKQREIAEKTDANADELRDISDKSLGDTRNALSLNEEILSIIDTELTALEATNSATIKPSPLDPIFSLKQLKSQFLAAVNGLRAQIRNLELSADEDRPPAQLSNLQRELTIKQLEIQEKTLELSREITGLQVKLARVNEGMMFPAAPFKGRVERIHVRIGQQVGPGTPLITYSGDFQTVTVVALVPEQIARNVSFFEPSVIHIAGDQIKSTPTYVSQEATNGQLYSIIYTLPESFQNKLTDKSNLRVEVPVGYPDTGSAVSFIPLDSIHQSQDTAIIFVEIDGVAQSREITLGNVFGRFVEVRDGLGDSANVIIDRNVINGEAIVAE